MNWTREKVNEFLAKVMNIECWKHEYSTDYAEEPCTKCGERDAQNFSAFNGDRLNHEVIDYLEKEMPEVWEEYIRNTAEVTDTWVELLDKWINPFNLAEWLSNNRESWGYTGCLNFDCQDGYCCNPSYVKTVCPLCYGTSRIKHPAFIWLEEEEKKNG